MYLYTAFSALTLGGIEPCRTQELCKSFPWVDVRDCWSLWKLVSQKSDSCPCCWGFHRKALPFHYFCFLLCHNCRFALHRPYSLVVLSQVVRREDIGLWQEMLPSLISLSNKGPIEVNFKFPYLHHFGSILFNMSSLPGYYFYDSQLCVRLSWLQWCCGGFLKTLLFTTKIWKVCNNLCFLMWMCEWLMYANCVKELNFSNLSKFVWLDQWVTVGKF